MSKLLSDEELGKLVDLARKSLVDGDTNRQKLTNDEFKFYVLDLINTQKRLYAEMVICEDLSLAEYRPNLIPAPDVETAIQIEGKNRHNELLKEQRARIK